MKKYPISKLKFISSEIRKDIIETLCAAGSGHPAGSLGMADIFTALYFNVLKIRPKNPKWDDRDRLILSNGHICPVWYATLARAGYFPPKELLSLRRINSRLQGHPLRNSLPGIENTAGPLGQGISVAAGIALAAKMNNKKHKIFCISSDGEHQEGQTWEAIMFAGHYNLNNLIMIVDKNNIQISGKTEDVMRIEPLVKKYEAFNWRALEIDGHNFEEIIKACEQAKTSDKKPTVIIARTIPGKGVSFMENNYKWHGQTLNEEEAEKALEQLDA